MDLRKNEGIYTKRDDHKKDQKEFDSIYYKTQDLEQIMDMKQLEGEAKKIVENKMSLKQKMLYNVKEFQNSEIYGKLDLEIDDINEEKAEELKNSIWKKVFDFSENKIYYMNSLTHKRFEKKPVGIDEDDKMEKTVIGPENAARMITNEWTEVEINEVPYDESEYFKDKNKNSDFGEKDLLKKETSNTLYFVSKYFKLETRTELFNLKMKS